MIGRRTLLTAATLLAARQAWAVPLPDASAQFITQAGHELTEVVGAASPAAVRDRLRPFMERVVDIDGVARFVLGRFWARADATQRSAYLKVYHDVLVANVASRLGIYQGGTTRIVTLRPVVRDDAVDVPTLVQREGANAVNVTWVVGDATGTLRIVDVIAEGVSLRLTQRSDFASFLNANGGNVGMLVDKLHGQLSATE